MVLLGSDDFGPGDTLGSESFGPGDTFVTNAYVCMNAQLKIKVHLI